MSKLRVGVAGPVGSGKTALVEALCRRLRDRRAELELAAGRAGFVVATHRTDAPAAQVLLWLWRMLDGAR